MVQAFIVVFIFPAILIYFYLQAAEPTLPIDEQSTVLPVSDQEERSVQEREVQEEKDDIATVDDQEKQPVEETIDGPMVYSNNELSITFPTPYEEANPSSQESTSIVFGPYGDVPEGPLSTKTRQYYFVEAEQRSKESVLSLIETDSLIEFKDELVINGYDVIRYTEAGLCVYPKVELIGEKANYLLFPVCGNGSETEFDYLTNVVKSVEFK